MYFGVDYHPEQWVYPYGGTRENPEAAWERDVELMQTAGINVVRMGEFTWGLCEPEDGKYNFDWLKRMMDLLGKAGIKIVLATPTRRSAHGRSAHVPLPGTSGDLARGRARPGQTRRHAPRCLPQQQCLL